MGQLCSAASNWTAKSSEVLTSIVEAFLDLSGVDRVVVLGGFGCRVKDPIVHDAGLRRYRAHSNSRGC